MTNGVCIEGFVGSILIPVLPINSVLFAISLPSLVRKRNPFLLYFAVSYVMIVLCVPLLSLRYFIVPLIFALLAVSVYVSKLRVMPYVLALIVGFNLMYIGSNYFWEFHQTDGTLHEYWSGDFYETNADMIDSLGLHECLTNSSAQTDIVPNIDELDHVAYMQDKTIKSEMIVSSMYMLYASLRYYSLGDDTVVSYKVIPEDGAFYVSYRNTEFQDILEERFTVDRRCAHLSNFEVFQVTNLAPT